MSVIPNTYVKYNNYIADANGDHRKVSTWTHASTVEMPDGSTLADATFGDNKVKQTPVNTGIYNLLLANGYGGYEETAGAKKEENLSYNVATKTMQNQGIYQANAKDNSTQVDYGSDVRPDDIVLYSQDQTRKVNTWDGTHTSLKDAIQAASGGNYTELTGTLIAGQTTLTIQNNAITTTATYDFFTDAFGVSPTDVEVTTGQIVLTFEEQESDMSVKVRIS